MNATYEHSGGLGLGPLLVPALGTVAALLLGLIYAYVTVYTPLAGYVSLLFVAGYGVGLAMSMMLIARLSKCRHTAFLGLAGLLVGLIALYADWAAFEAVLLGKSIKTGKAPGYVDLLLHPAAVWRVCLLINESGWYSIKAATPTGGVLWAFWGIEAAVVVGATTVGALGAISGEVFCEHCNQWCPERPVGLQLTIPEERDLERVVEGDLDALAAIDPPFAGQPVYLQVEVKHCETCDATATYQVKLVKHGVDDKGKPTVETKELSPQFLADPGTIRRLEELAQRPAPSPQRPSQRGEQQPEAE